MITRVSKIVERARYGHRDGGADVDAKLSTSVEIGRDRVTNVRGILAEDEC